MRCPSPPLPPVTSATAPLSSMWLLPCARAQLGCAPRCPRRFVAEARDASKSPCQHPPLDLVCACLRKELAVTFDHSAPRRPVNLNLNADLVERCKSEVGNLSAHVEELLAADLERRAAAAKAEKRRIERAIDAFSALYEAHGSLSEEMQSL